MLIFQKLHCCTPYIHKKLPKFLISWNLGSDKTFFGVGLNLLLQLGYHSLGDLAVVSLDHSICCHSRSTLVGALHNALDDRYLA